MTTEKTQTEQPLVAEITIKYNQKAKPSIKIDSSQAAHEILRKCYDNDTINYTETAHALFINRANKVIGTFHISSGGCTATVVDPKPLFAAVLKCGAQRIILSHNHPSGNMKPSQQDKLLTSRIKDICKLFNIELLDHLIITDESYFSFADNLLLTQS